MTQELPKILDIRRLIDRQESVSGVVPVGRLSRITLPFSPSKDVAVEMRLANDDPTRPKLVGAVSTQVTAICQRCLEEMVVDIEKHFDVVLRDGGDQQDEIADESEDVIDLQDEKLNIDQFVEDEVMLGCPMVPLHDDERCHAIEGEPAPKTDEKRQPFVGLAELLATAREKPDR